MEDFKVGFPYLVGDNRFELQVVVCEGHWIPVKQVAEAMGNTWAGCQVTKAKKFHAEPKATANGKKPLCIHMDHLQAWLDSFKASLGRVSDAKRVSHFIEHLMPTLAHALLYDPTVDKQVVEDNTIYVGRELDAKDIAIKQMTGPLRMHYTDAKLMADTGFAIVMYPGRDHGAFVEPAREVMIDINAPGAWKELDSACKAGKRVMNLGEIEYEKGKTSKFRVGERQIYTSPGGELLSDLPAQHYTWLDENDKPTKLPALSPNAVRVQHASAG